MTNDDGTDKAGVLQGTLILLVLRTLEALGPLHGYGIARRIEQINRDVQYSIATRTHEIGIRMAVGAQAAEIFRMIIGEGLKLSLTGLMLGLLGAIWWVRRAPVCCSELPLRTH